MDCADHVLYINPTHPLPPVANLSTYAHLERRQHFSERAARGAEHDAGAHLHGTDTSVGGSLRRRLPLAANLGQEPEAGLTLLVQYFITPVAVVSNCRAADEDLRPDFGLR